MVRKLRAIAQYPGNEQLAQRYQQDADLKQLVAFLRHSARREQDDADDAFRLVVAPRGDAGGPHGGGGGRGVFKATPLYRNVNRDLVDTIREDADVLSRIEKQHLPEAMQELSLAECRAYVDRFAARRSDVQKQIRLLSAEREQYVAQERKLIAGGSNEGTLGVAVVTAIREQLADAGFEAVVELHP